ncbi:MAG: methionine adenosyltransferase [Rhodospirillaceae bacterium]|uniref:S-adenosylmethionine synthase n=1 Tax=Candidatus Moanibacter tarae TaxID=2200854 RepID=A0A2Z4AFC4_9BACT|nr:MAG: S-adenosylmethionine synthase [Candidatus Moanabacter tarae]MBH66947.1 methionine adenosyltransferase [Rhodospirillaceae bacterium]|tara:strand:- start:2255 stop:3424 length:1170 start_codon:yes stop_codon:yes gene_type:complete
MPDNFIFSSESVGEGHPDKVADYISDSVLDACLVDDRRSRVACETLVKSNTVILAGEITTKSNVNYEAVVRKAIREIGYTNKDDSFHADRVFITNLLTRQSADIAQGVNASKAPGKLTAEQGAGDQGLMFGYACNETPEKMPAPITFAHRLTRRLAHVRKIDKISWLRPDCKSQVAVRYQNGRPKAITSVVVSTQHSKDSTHRMIRKFCIDEIIRKVLPESLLNSRTEFLVNPTGRFVIGGPEGDSGLTGRKIIVDSYGGWGRHGGGCFSGKDPSKVDRSAAYMCRWIAKCVVAAKLAERVEIQVAYAIGHPDPTSVHVETFGTGMIKDEIIASAISEVFSLKPADIIGQLDLIRPIYRKTTNYGHFAKRGLPWESIAKAKELEKAAIG